MPSYIVTTHDKPTGRKLAMTPTVVKQWAIDNKIPFFDPAKLDAEFTEQLKKCESEVFIVASYGKIIPEAIVNMPSHGSLNIHPSLLPKYRGPSPLPTSILDDVKNTGVTIIKMDKEMDHGPIIAQKEITINEWPNYADFEENMAKEGAKLLAEVLPKWIAGEIKERVQDHSSATFTKKIIKEDGLIDLKADPYVNFRKIQAYSEWPQAYFFINKSGKQLRVKITSASYKAGALIIEKVIPEGSKEMSYKDFSIGYL